MKMKNYAGIIAGFMIVIVSNCGYSQVNPIGEKAFNDYTNWFKAWGGHLNTDLKIIPVVIHVIYRNNIERLQVTRPRIYGQIETTNKQLRRLNANANETRPRFLPVAADCNIQVALATRKPDGSRFDGIIYHNYPDFNFRRDQNAIWSATILDPNKYLNVWVFDTSAGSAINPWNKNPYTDGFWMGSQIFGITGSNLSPIQNGGVTFTHELGHYLGLWHTFQNGNHFLNKCDLAFDGSICDFCADTPLDWESRPDIPETCDNGIRNGCEEPPLRRVIAQTENYMGYNPDKCINMFSKDQRARMRACLYGRSYRSELVSLRNLLFTGVKWTDLRDNNNRYSQSSALPDENDLVFEKYSPKNDITTFPNPAKSTVHLTYRNPAIKNMTVKVYNQTGIKLKEFYSNTAIYELNLDGLPDGVYYLNMTIDNVPVTKRIIKIGSGGVSSAQ